MESIDLLGVKVQSLTRDKLNEAIETKVKQQAHALVLHVNASTLNLAYSSPWLRECLNRAEIVHCDGAGVIVGARILGHSIPERITYADWIWQLAGFAEPRGLKFFFLGDYPGVSDQAAERLKERFPRLQVVGTYHGYFDKTRGSSENERVVKMINEVSPNILIVGFGQPLQERWLMENWDRIQANVALTGGAVFRYAARRIQRGPRWMTDNGMEWLARLIIEPRRLWKRYVLGNPLFLWRVIKQRFGLLRLE